MTAPSPSFAPTPGRFAFPDSRSLARIDTAAIERALFVATVLLAAGMIWIVPHPPLADLPQHAAQVTLWRDLLAGTSPWSALVRINLLTPYLIGYGATLPLAFVMPVADALRVVLTLAFFGFVGGSIALRRSFGGDPRLDWLFLFGFFGFAWHFGFFTFLVAAPVALFFLAAADGHGRAPSVRCGLGLVLLGVVLLFSHGLQFVVALALGGAVALWRNRTRAWSRIVGAALPFAALAAMTLGFRLLTAQADGAMRFDEVKYGAFLWLKPVVSLLYVTSLDLAGNAVPFGLTVLMLFAPRLRGAVLNRGAAVIPFAGLVVVMALLPSYAFQTAYLFHRFALFLLPFYALMFRPGEPRLAGDWRFLPLCLAAWLTLGIEAERLNGSAAEAKPFEAVLAAAEPGRRALALVFDPASPATGNRYAHLHDPSWYGAEKGGFVDFNFAAFFPQVVRFRPGAALDYPASFSLNPGSFDASAASERPYDYIFVRGTAADVGGLLDRSGCRFALRAAAGPWTLLERQSCPDEGGLKGSLSVE